MPASDALTTLGELAEQRHRDPEVALEGATALLAATDDPRVEALAYQVIGLAEYELGRVAEAVTSFRRAVAISVEHGWADGEAATRAHLAISLLALGDGAAAEREIAVAEARAAPANRGLVATRRALVLQRTGRFAEALAVYQRALRWLEDENDRLGAALVYLNRGILHAYQGHHAPALENLAQAEEIFRARGLPRLLAMTTHNMGFALTRLGDLPGALAAFDRAGDAFAALGNPARLVAVGEADRCEALLLAGLVAEGRAAATRAVEALVAVGDHAYLSEGRLLLARALLMAGDFPAAVAEAARAAQEFQSASRLPWAALAKYVAIQAEILEIEDRATFPPAALLTRCRRIASELEAQGWPVESVHVRTFAGRLALAMGRPGVAHSELYQAVAARRRGTADQRAQAWHAAALLRLAEGDRGGARRALTRGMAVVDEYRGSLGATELRIHAASYGTDLARLGIRLALEERRAREVLRWAERWRAGALQRPPVRPPDDERLAATLTDLRQAHAELRAAALQGPPGMGPDGSPAAGMRRSLLQSRVAELERAVRNQTLQARDDRAATGQVDIASIQTALGERVLVEYVSWGDQLYAVTVTRDRVRLHDLGPIPIEHETRYLTFAIRRLWSHAARPAAEKALDATACRVDDLLLRPLRLPPTTPIVIVPTGVLHGLPWSALPSIAERPTTVAPSAALWLGNSETGPVVSITPHPGAPAPATDTERRVGPRRPSVVLVAGPQLAGAEDEVRQIAPLYPNSLVLSGADASAPAVMAALPNAGMAHLAAHGRFRADSPLFSSVLLADGPLTVYDLERMDRGPTTVILAACDAAVSDVRAGDELLGTAAALIGLGVRRVVAPVMPVPDGATTAFMVALHRHLLAGDRLSTALAAARAEQDRTVGAAFICIGCEDT